MVHNCITNPTVCRSTPDMPLHAGNKCCVFHSLPCVMQSESMQLNSLLEATFGCSHQAVSRGARTHCPLSTKNTNLISVSPPHLWLTDGAQTTMATTTQLHPRPPLSSSTISRWSPSRIRWTRLPSQSVRGRSRRTCWTRLLSQQLRRLRRGSSHRVPRASPRESRIASAWSSS